MEIDELPLGKAEDLKGQKFGKLTALYRVKPPEHVKNKTVYWKCKCDCGKTHITNARSLKSGSTTSCGCNKGPRPENAKVIDETGNQYGLLTVIERAGSNKTGQALWKCKCKCGNETIVEGTRLRYGDAKSCGCLIGKSNVKLIPPGTRFGHLTVLQREGSKDNRAIYKCQCDCGNIIIVDSNKLRTGNTKSCGCNLKYQPTPEEWSVLTHKDEVPLRRAENLSGQKFGLLTALYRTKVPETSKSKHEAFWKCRCDCGNFTTVIASALKNGTSQSCGCLQKSLLSQRTIKDIPIGTRFGYLTVLEQLPNRNKQKLVLYRCQCDCGNIHIAPGTELRKGNINSCGCAKNSHGEEKIKNILQNNNLAFIKEKSFEKCISHKGYKLRFDFYVNDKYLIEYDGKQHFYAVDYFGGEEEFKLVQERDKIKNEYCKSHNIPLIRIPYWHYNDITIEDLKPETSQFLV